MSSSPTDRETSGGPAEAVELVQVTMPQMGVSVVQGTLTVWRKQTGDWVNAEETICEISTDKIDTEIPAPVSGHLAELLVTEGETVAVGTVLARIATGPPSAVPELPSPGIELPSPGIETGAANGGSRRYSPVVQRIAETHDIDLDRVPGSGRGGRVRKQDVLAFLEAPAAKVRTGDRRPAEPVPLHTESPYRAAEQVGPVPANGDAGEPLSRMRRSIAEHMVRSLHTAAHCTTIIEADMSGVQAARARLGLSPLPFVARACIDALRELPALNATLEGDRLTLHRDVNLGIAVSLGEEGLIVPVIRRAQDLSAEGLARRISELARRARGGELTPDEVRGGSFTITNPGRYGTIAATPIINQPQVAILDIEAVVKRPVVVDGERGDSIAIRPIVNLCLSWDHRALDGVMAARFLGRVREHIEAVEG